MIQPDQYRLSIPTGQRSIVVTEIEPVDYFRKGEISFHFGTAIPTGVLADSFDVGINTIVDLGYNFTPRFGLIGNFGYNNFKSKTSGVDDNYWLNLSINLKYRGLLPPSPNSTWYYYLQAGPGYYIPKTGDRGAGANFGAGFNYDVNNFLTFEIGTDYHTLFSQEIKFWHAHAGVIFRF